jgi:AcrR family transcriptional regulator
MQEIKNLSAYRRSLKDKIMETSMKAFAKDGIKAVRMDSIAKSLNISKRTLYEIYKTKEELLFEGVKTYKALQEQKMEEVARGKSDVMDIILYVYRQKVEEFRKTCPQFYNDLVKYPAIMEYLSADRQRNQRQMVAFLERGVGEGYFRPEINKELVVIAFESFGNFIMERRLYEHYSIGTVFMNIQLVALRGICTMKGIEVLDRFMKSQNP